MCLSSILVDVDSSEAEQYQLRNGGFNYNKFVRDAKEKLALDAVLDPRGLVRSSRQFGNKDKPEVAIKKMVSAANVSQVGWKRVRLASSGYGYKKIAIK